MSPSKFLESENAIQRRDPNEHPGHGGGGGASYAPPLKINKDSHFIKKPPSPPSSSSAVAVAAAAAKPRHPVIIYTHSPKVIHTNPKDFMALVQKLTGMSRSDDDLAAATDRRGKPATRVVSDPGEDTKNNNSNANQRLNSYNRSYTGNVAGNRKGIFVNNANFSEDSECSSVITAEENIGEQGQVNSSSCSFTAVPAIPHPSYPAPPPPSASPVMFDAAAASSGINYGAYLSTIPIFATNPSDEYLCANQSLANFEMDPLFFASSMRSSFSSSSFDGLREFRDF